MEKQRVARFSKVSLNQFKKDLLDCLPDFPVDEIESVYNEIKLPKRATSGSAGQDFFLPIGIDLKAGESVKIPTGIHCEMENGWVLMCYPRSGLGFKYGMRFANSVGVIDQDYFYAENEGHIHCKFSVEKDVRLEQGKAFMQGVFTPYGITYDDEADGVRTGGFGSTDRKEV